MKPISLLSAYVAKVYEATDHWLVLPVIAIALYKGEPWYGGMFLWVCFSSIFMVWCFALSMFYAKAMRPSIKSVVSRPVANLADLWFSFPLVFCAGWAEAEIARLQAEIDELDTQES